MALWQGARSLAEGKSLPSDPSACGSCLWGREGRAAVGCPRPPARYSPIPPSGWGKSCPGLGKVLRCSHLEGPPRPQVQPFRRPPRALRCSELSPQSASLTCGAGVLRPASGFHTCGLGPRPLEPHLAGPARGCREPLHCCCCVLLSQGTREGLPTEVRVGEVRGALGAMPELTDKHQHELWKSLEMGSPVPIETADAPA